MATCGSATDKRRREDDLRTCQRRLEYLSSRLQDLAVEIGDGEGAIWLKQNMWYLSKQALYFDDVLFAVGKICNHLVAYLTFHKQKLASNFPFLSYMGILYEVGEILGCVRDMLLVNPKENYSFKKTQIELFWTDCTPFLFVFENSNHLLLRSDQIPIYMKALLDLVPSVIQVGMCMYCLQDSKLRGFDCFADTCIRLSRALVESGEFLSMVEHLEPVIVPFLRQWILFALELVQNGVKVKTDQCLLSPKVSKELSDVRKEVIYSRRDSDHTEVKTVNVLSISSDSSLPDEVAEGSLAPLKIRNSCLVRTSCQPFRWIDVANTRLGNCPNEMRKLYIEEIALRENQKLISDIFILYGKQPTSWRGIKLHCPLTKRYDEVKLKLFVKVKVGEQWIEKEANYDQSFNKGHFLVFDGCRMEGFVAIEERPMTAKEIGPKGGHIKTAFDSKMEAHIPEGAMSSAGLVKMMVQPPDKPAERRYRDKCPDDFKHIKSTSNAIEIEGVNTKERKISLTIPFNVLKDPHTKILVLKYTSDTVEVNEAEGLLEQTDDENCFTVNSNGGGTVLATVDHRTYSTGTEANVRREMEVLLGKKQLCKLLIFVENLNAQKDAQTNLDQFVLSIVCAEKYRISNVIKDKTKIGMIEVPKSQSPDRLLKQADDIRLEIKGGVSLDPDIPEDAYTLTYLEGSDNYVRLPLKVTDFNGRMTVVLRLCRDNSVLHTYFCNTQDILALLGVPLLFTEQTSSDLLAEENGQQDHTAEANLKILNRNSLVNLAKHVIADEGSLLGMCLGLKAEKISQICRTYRHSSSLASFYILYEWRGRKTDPDLADKLIKALSDIGRRDLANIVTDVRKQNRGLQASDFPYVDTKRRYRMS